MEDAFYCTLVSSYLTYTVSAEANSFGLSCDPLGGRFQASLLSGGAKSYIGKAEA